MHVLRPAIAIVLTAGLAAPAFPAEEQLVLKDGRRFRVTRMERRAGKVRFQTTRGDSFEVPEDQVASPPLDSIPMSSPPAEAPAPQPQDQPAAQEQTLVLKDGRRIQVLRLARRGGLVIFQTTRGEGFSVTEDQVVSPPLESIPRLDRPGATAPTPPPPGEQPGVTPPPTEPTVPAPAPPTVPPTVEAPGGVPDFVPMPDRWEIPYPDYPGRIIKGRTIDPYNQNVLKGDKPVIGNSVFFVFTGVLDTPTEARRLPLPSGVSAADPEAREFFGRGEQLFTTPRAFLSAELFKGQTAFRPKTFALKVTTAFNLNYLRLRENNGVNIDVREGKTRRREDFSLEEAFAEAKLADLSPNFDAVSVRAGIQPFVSDFRGFIFSDSNLGARLFGNIGNNRWSYNAAYFDLLEKETNSELNTFEKREQQVFIANVFRQDTFRLGYTLSLSAHHSRDDPSVHYDANGFLVRPQRIGSVRPHEVKSTYLGLAGDGHLGRINVSHAYYYVFGEDEDNPLADRAVDIRAQMAALELSIDKDWARFRASGFFATGDDDASDEKASGFDTIYDFTNFAGGAFSFWTRSGIPLTQTAVLLKTPGSLLPSLRSNKFEGQASFVNPGLLLFNAGLDVEVTPKLKAIVNANYLRFHRTGALELLLFQPGIRKTIGIDVGAGVVYRPLLNENVVITAGVTGLVPGAAFDDLFSSPCSAPACGASARTLYNGFVSLKLTY
jgi:hypothetical protein